MATSVQAIHARPVVPEARGEDGSRRIDMLVTPVVFFPSYWEDRERRVETYSNGRLQ